MEKLARFMIYPNERSFGPFVSDPAEYQQLLKLASDLGVAYPGEANQIRCALDHPGLPVILKRLEELGWTAFFGDTPPELRKTHFRVRTLVTYTRADIGSADCLRLLDSWGGTQITDCVARRNGRWVGRVAAMSDNPDEGWERTHGTVWQWHNYFVSSATREHFERLGLRLVYHPLEWDEPEKAQGEFWEIDSPLVMPECLTPMESQPDGYRYYQDAGCEPAELRFRRDEVALMGDFDAAWTREEVGKPGNMNDGGHLLVVSQRFRRACEEIGLENTHFTPARLVP